MVAVEVLQLLAYFFQREALIVEEPDFIPNLVVDVGLGGHYADPVVVPADGHLGAVQASDYTV